jgi:3-oxoacyl-[acyl-carrier-protein] synthase-3
MPGLRISGTGRYLPGRPYTNEDLSRVMDTSDEWIRQRTGISQRHYAPEGQGAADLAVPAAQLALEAAGKRPEDVDYILFNTMTPDHVFPGSGAILGEKLGCLGAPALDLRAQCAAMIYSLQVASALIGAGGVKNVLIVGAEAHAGFMPWRDWDVLEGTSDRKPSAEAWERATRHRGLSIIFGDGAGAVLVERTESSDVGVLSVDIHTDGRYADQLYMPVGFKRRPFLSAELVESEAGIPLMSGREVFKHAVTKLPASVHTACERANVRLEDVDWFIAHQANDRINDAVREKLRLPPEKVPSNIARYGNTSGATIPILVDEMRRDGRLRDGQLVCFFALGAGLHWGSAIVRL